MLKRVSSRFLAALLSALLIVQPLLSHAHINPIDAGGKLTIVSQKEDIAVRTSRLASVEEATLSAIEGVAARRARNFGFPRVCRTD